MVETTGTLVVLSNSNPLHALTPFYNFYLRHAQQFFSSMAAMAMKTA